jgi:hypothetical protein
MNEKKKIIHFSFKYYYISWFLFAFTILILVSLLYPFQQILESKGKYVRTWWEL